jgi:hypothetical protein
MLKMDFLGLKTLSILNTAVKNVKLTTGKKIDLDNLKLDDPKTYELFQSGYTNGNNSYVLGSSSFKLSKSIFFPVVSFTFFTAVFSIDRVFNPKKSIFNIPADSITLLSN